MTLQEHSDPHQAPLCEVHITHTVTTSRLVSVRCELMKHIGTLVLEYGSGHLKTFNKDPAYLASISTRVHPLLHRLTHHGLGLFFPRLALLVVRFSRQHRLVIRTRILLGQLSKRHGRIRTRPQGQVEP